MGGWVGGWVGGSVQCSIYTSIPMCYLWTMGHRLLIKDPVHYVNRVALKAVVPTLCSPTLCFLTYARSASAHRPLRRDVKAPRPNAKGVVGLIGNTNKQLHRQFSRQ